jgi:hypothetical protein
MKRGMSKAAVLVSTCVGAFITLCSLYAAFAYGIHDGFRIAGYLFPYAVLLSPTLDSVGILSVLLAVVQFPIYGFLLGFWWRRRTRLVVCCGLIVLAHCVAVVGAERAVESVPVRIMFDRQSMTTR